MIIPKIPKNQAQPACPVKAINPATPIATATPDQPLRFTLFPFLFILSYLQITKGLVDFKSIGSLNYATHTDENENLTHEDTFGVSSCLTSFGLSTLVYKKNALASPTLFFRDAFFPNSLSANFCKLSIINKGNLQ